MELLAIHGDDIIVAPSHGGAFGIGNRSTMMYLGTSAALLDITEEHRLLLHRGNANVLGQYVLPDPFEPGQFALLACRFALTVRGFSDPVITDDAFREIVAA